METPRNGRLNGVADWWGLQKETGANRPKVTAFHSFQHHIFNWQADTWGVLKRFGSGWRAVTRSTRELRDAKYKPTIWVVTVHMSSRPSVPATSTFRRPLQAASIPFDRHSPSHAIAAFRTMALVEAGAGQKKARLAGTLPLWVVRCQGEVAVEVDQGQGSQWEKHDFNVLLAAEDEVAAGIAALALPACTGQGWNVVDDRPLRVCPPVGALQQLVLESASAVELADFDDDSAGKNKPAATEADAPMLWLVKSVEYQYWGTTRWTICRLPKANNSIEGVRNAFHSMMLAVMEAKWEYYRRIVTTLLPRYAVRRNTPATLREAVQNVVGDLPKWETWQPILHKHVELVEQIECIGGQVAAYQDKDGTTFAYDRDRDHPFEVASGQEARFTPHQNLFQVSSLPHIFGYGKTDVYGCQD